MDEVLRQLEHYLTTEAYQIVVAQVNTFGRDKKGYRWSKELKNIALTIRTSSNKCYLKIRKIFRLPCVKTLQGLLDSIKVTESFHRSILEGLALKAAESTNPADLEVSMSFDEMSLTPQLEYDVKADKIVGLDSKKAGKLPVVNSVGVFMIRGLKCNFKQPIGFFYSSGPMEAERLVTLVREAILKVNNTGYKCKAFIMDQGPNNSKAMRLLNGNQSVLSNSDGTTTYMFYDPPHLIKNTRNNFKANGFVNSEGDKISWTTIERLHQLNQEQEINFCPKLKDTHINMEAFKEMSVKRAAQV